MQITRSDINHDNLVQNRSLQERRGFFPWPECHILPALKAYDDNLNVLLNQRNGKVRVIDDTYHCIMEVEYHEVNQNLVEHVKKIDSRNGYRALKVMEQAEAKRLMDEQKKTDDIAYNLAKDMRRPLLETTLYGR